MTHRSDASRTAAQALILLVAAAAVTALFIITSILATAEALSPVEERSNALAIWQMLGSIFAVLLVGLVVAGVALLLKNFQDNREASTEAAARLARVESLLEGQGDHLRDLAQMAALSDQAKSLIYYEQEIEAFHETIHALLLKQDYSSAEAMIKRMEQQFGLAEEADRLRQQVAAYRQKSVNDKVDAAVERIEEILQRREWAQARRETDRVLALWPDNDRVQALPGRVQEAWNAYKRELLKDYGEAVRVNDVERSIELLKELDKYLTPQEGAALAESARGVFKAKLHNLGVQFSISVAEQQWDDAVTTGEEIIAEFPNSRMAREVGEKLDLLRAYASGEKSPHQFVGGPGATA
jgi:uncharacterized protein YqgQ